jgi:hypothetical protein
LIFCSLKDTAIGWSLLGGVVGANKPGQAAS